MKLVFIYGPPAVGKLTVAEAVATLTGYKLFHNHLTVDLARAFFEFGTPAFGQYIDHLRFEAFDTAAREGVSGVIFTFCYALGFDDDFVRDVQSIIAKHNGEIYFVQLICDRAESERRVLSESRRRFHKLNDVDKWRAIIGRREMYQPIPFVSSLSIDNTHVPAEEAARRVVAHYEFPEVPRA